MLRMVRFGVVDSMDCEVRSIALQSLLKLQHNADLLSPQTQTLLEEVGEVDERNYSQHILQSPSIIPNRLLFVGFRQVEE